MRKQLLRYSNKLYIKRIFTLTVVLTLILFQNINLYACTIFTKQQGNEVLVGNNEDFYYSYDSNIWFVAAAKDSYGRVCFANSTYVQGGMNEKGLFYDGAACPNTNVPYSANKPTLGMDLGEVVLSKCSNIYEAVEFLKNHNIPSGYGDHILFVDETGKSVIVEWVEGEMKVIFKEQDYQIATNYFVSNPKLGGYPSKRYDTAKSMLENDEVISVGSFKNILSAVSQDGKDKGTKYSNVYDIRKKDVYVFTKRDFSKYVYFNLDEELKKLKTGEKKLYNIDKLDYKTFDNISSNSNKEISDSLSNPPHIDKPDKSPQLDEKFEYKWYYSIPVVLIVFTFFIKRLHKKS